MAIVQSSTATALIVSAFVGQGLIALPAALAVMLGADIGTSVMAVVFSLDLSWLSPLFIFAGVVLYVLRPDTTVGRLGRVFIGLGMDPNVGEDSEGERRQLAGKPPAQPPADPPPASFCQE